MTLLQSTNIRLKINGREDYRNALYSTLVNDLFRCNCYTGPKIFSFRKVSFLIIETVQDNPEDSSFLYVNHLWVQDEVVNDLADLEIEVIKMN